MERKLFICRVDYNESGRRNNDVIVNLKLTDDNVFSASADVWRMSHKDIYRRSVF